MFDTRIRAAALVLVAAGSVVLAGCRGAQPSGNVSPGPGGPDAVKLTTVDTRFEPARLELPAGEQVEVEIRNDGPSAHDFTVDALDLSTGAIPSGDVMTATFTVPQGDTPFHCSLHPGMDGVIVGT